MRVGKNIKLYNYDRTETRSKENDDDFDLLVRRNIRNSQINDGNSNWWIMLITAGGCGIWALYDLIMLFMDKLPMADGRPLES
ncbi:MAG TPA: hypothetical protein PKN32_14905 [Bacteroidales bacterium]|nr:hypothetical protein [Bacteroidales bacterium]